MANGRVEQKERWEVKSRKYKMNAQWMRFGKWLMIVLMVLMELFWLIIHSFVEQRGKHTAKENESVRR